MASKRYLTEPEFRTWRAMRDRCENANSTAHRYYGGRGIKVFPEWSKSYEAFLAYVGRKPRPDFSIERINNDGDYEPGNVRWASRIDQACNKSMNHRIVVHGQEMTISQAARKFGIPYFTPQARVKKLHWSAEEAVTAGVGEVSHQKRQVLVVDGVELTLTQIAAKYGISRGVVAARLKAGWDICDIAKVAIRPADNVIEFRGERYTVAEASDRFGIRYNTLKSRLLKGWTVDEAITTPVIKRRTFAAKEVA